MSRREHTIRLPYGFRIEHVTETTEGSREVRFNATVYDGSEQIAEHVQTQSKSARLITCGDLIRVRGEFIDDCVSHTEQTVQYLIASRDFDRALAHEIDFVNA